MYNAAQSVFSGWCNEEVLAGKKNAHGNVLLSQRHDFVPTPLLECKGIFLLVTC